MTKQQQIEVLKAVWPEGIPSEDYAKAVRVAEALGEMKAELPGVVDFEFEAETETAPVKPVRRRGRPPAAARESKLRQEPVEKHGSKKGQVLEFLKKEGAKTAQDLSIALDIDPSRVRSILWAMGKNKEVKKKKTSDGLLWAAA